MQTRFEMELDAAQASARDSDDARPELLTGRNFGVVTVNFPGRSLTRYLPVRDVCTWAERARSAL